MGSTLCGIRLREMPLSRALGSGCPLDNTFLIVWGLRRGRNAFAFDVGILVSLSTGIRKWGTNVLSDNQFCTISIL